jgi:hypothetical protein
MSRLTLVSYLHHPKIQPKNSETTTRFLFLKFAVFELEKMLLHIFEPKTERLAQAPRIKAWKAQEPWSNETGRGNPAQLDAGRRLNGPRSQLRASSFCECVVCSPKARRN